MTRRALGGGRVIATEMRLQEWESIGLHGCVAGMKGNENRKIGLQGRLTNLLQVM